MNINHYRKCLGMDQPSGSVKTPGPASSPNPGPKRAGLAGPHEHHVADVVARVLSKIPDTTKPQQA